MLVLPASTLSSGKTWTSSPGGLGGVSTYLRPDLAQLCVNPPDPVCPATSPVPLLRRGPGMPSQQALRGPPLASGLPPLTTLAGSASRCAGRAAGRLSGRPVLPSRAGRHPMRTTPLLQQLPDTGPCSFLYQFRRRRQPGRLPVPFGGYGRTVPPSPGAVNPVRGCGAYLLLPPAFPVCLPHHRPPPLCVHCPGSLLALPGAPLACLLCFPGSGQPSLVRALLAAAFCGRGPRSPVSAGRSLGGPAALRLPFSSITVVRQFLQP